MNQPLLRIRDLHFGHGDMPVVRGIDLELGNEEILIIIGPSGCGKSTLLRLVAGLELPQFGTVELEGRMLSGHSDPVPPEARPVGMVFQGLALFPHLNVSGNVGFGLHHLPKAERKTLVMEELKVVGLEGLEHRYPHQLSGGQQQRVAIARAMVRRPKVLLMDEPFSDLDARTRRQVRGEVARILREHGTAAIIVSHDREDALHLGDRIAEMDEGRIVRIAPADVLRQEWAATMVHEVDRTRP
jgi:iron(III) transport system ATP-binding protein